MRVPRTVTYALAAILELAGQVPGHPLSATEISNRRGLPCRFLVQVMRTLVKAGLAKSTIGVSGGYCLLQPPDEIRLLDVIDAFDNPLSFRFNCLAGIEEPAAIAFENALAEATLAARHYLTNYTIADLMVADQPSNANRDVAKDGAGQQPLQNAHVRFA